MDAALRSGRDFGWHVFGANRSGHGSGVHGAWGGRARRAAVLGHGDAHGEFWRAAHSVRHLDRTEARWLKVARYQTIDRIADLVRRATTLRQPARPRFAASRVRRARTIRWRWTASSMSACVWESSVPS